MPDVAPVQSETASVPNAFGGQPAPSTSTDFKVPEAYAGKPWVEKIKSSDDLWKTLDNSQQLIGKKFSPPAETASEQEWNDYFKSQGRPDDPKGYQFKPVEGLPEGTDLAPFQEKASNIFHKAGLTPKQADAVWQMYIKEELSSVNQSGEASKEQNAKLEKEWADVQKEAFGDKYDDAAKNAKALIMKGVPENLRGSFDELADHPKAQAAMIKALDYAHSEIEKTKKEFGAEGKLTTGDATATDTAPEVLQNLTNLRLKAAKIGAGPEYNKLVEEIKIQETRYRSMVK